MSQERAFRTVRLHMSFAMNHFDGLYAVLRSCGYSSSVCTLQQAQNVHTLSTAELPSPPSYAASNFKSALLFSYAEQPLFFLLAR